MKKDIHFFSLTTALVVFGFAVLSSVNSRSTNSFSLQQEMVGADGPQVMTANGIVEGRLEKSGIRSFKGIPFAAPPTGDLRWKEPQPVQNWDTVRKAVEFGPRPMQTAVFGDMAFRSATISEDCLYLNVWVPKKAKSLLPVLVYFYGGGFVAGDGSEGRYDGESMAQKGIVTLTVNYRLGVFGFLAHPELTNETSYKGSGNYGLLDQLAALRWVQQNIAAFGGDPKKVTIAGESAGSVSVSAQMASPLSKNLIAGAIGESGSLLGALPAIPLKNAEQLGIQFAKAIHANSLADLRAMNADSLLQSAAKFVAFRFSMNVDGYFFPKSPYEIYKAGEQANVPLLVGWNNQEMNYRVIMGAEKPTKENFTNAVRRLYGANADEVLALYNPADDGETEQVATDLAGDRFIAFSTWKWSDIHSKTSTKKVYRYLYEKPRPPMKKEMGNAVPGLAGGVQKADSNVKAPVDKGAVHSAEIEYAMGNLHYNKVYAWTDEDYKVSAFMQTYFANFIKTGDPNGGGLPAWPDQNSKSPSPVMHIDVKTRVEPEQYKDRYLFIDRISEMK